jgi:immune inhibitor A
MVAPHPDLQKKIRNTKKLVKERKEHLIPGLVQQFPDQYLPLENFNIFESLKPWVEISKPRKTPPSNLRTLAPIRDRVIVLCVDFPDKPAQVSTATIYNRFFSSTGKTFRNYFAENSYGKYIPEGEVHGWYRALQPMTYYVDNQNGFGTYPNNIQKLVEDVVYLAAADPAITWSSFDNDEDNVIDYVVIVHAGAEAAYTGSLSDFWAHVWAINPIIMWGYKFEYYATVSEFMSSPTDIQRTGIDSHEFGHLLGLPDLYDYSGNSNGTGYYSIMSHGSWADNAITPVHLDAWSKYYCGFSNTLVNQSGMLLVDNAETNDVNYLFTTQYPNEYFMIENRQNTYFDTFLPANGLLVWKVNVYQSHNDNELCYKVGLVQADGMKHLEKSVNYGDPGDSYPGTTINRAVGKVTVPSTVMCDGSYPSFLIRNITDSASLMSFVVELCPHLVANILIV